MIGPPPGGEPLIGVPPTPRPRVPSQAISMFLDGVRRGSGRRCPRGRLEQPNGWAEGHHYGTEVQQHLTIEKNDEASWRSSCGAWRMCRPIGDRPAGPGMSDCMSISLISALP